MDKLDEAFFYLDNWIKTRAASPSDAPHLLSNNCVKDLPTFHRLASFPFQEEDIPRLDIVIEVFTEFGYDINKTTDLYPSECTALLASIEEKNLILMECLLRHGAPTDIRDKRGWSPCHLAIIVGELKILEKLVQFGGPSVVASASGGDGSVLPLLHMAIERQQTEIGSYLLSKWEEFGVDVNENSIYEVNEPNGKRIRLEVTPLERALRMGNVPIIQEFLRHPGVRLSGCKELHACIKIGLTEIALFLLNNISAEQLASDKIQDQWGLHCLPPHAFHTFNSTVTNKLILEYVRRGWDVNSVSTSPITAKMTLMESGDVPVTLTRYSLLQLACIYKGQDVIKVLVEEAGVDINSKTEGTLELTPLQISLAMKQWKSVKYLIEKGADLGVRGSFNTIPFTRVIRKNLITGALELTSSLSTVELLVRMGCDDGLPVLSKVLARPDVIWQGANEFHLALEGANPFYISKVLKHCAKLISKEDLSWITFWNAKRGISEEVPTLLHLLSTYRVRIRLVDVPALAKLINLLVSLGYDLNLARPFTRNLIQREGILYHILAIDSLHQEYSNLLLRTILQVDHFRLNLSEIQGTRQSGTLRLHSGNWESLLGLRNVGCSSYAFHCWDNKLLPKRRVEAIKLLLTHGLDVSKIVIGRTFKYHLGYNVVLKMMYSAGAQISEEFFTSPKICHPGHPKTQQFLQEIAEVKQWKDEFDRKEGSSLKHLCRLRLRKMLKCIGDLKELDGLPAGLKEYVLLKA